AKQIASLDLMFTTRVAGIPQGHVTLLDWSGLRKDDEPRKNSASSPYALSFIDNSLLWNEPRTRLCIAAADIEGITRIPAAEAQREVFLTLQRYLDLDETLVDWERSCFQRNGERPLFINTVGSWECRPDVRADRPSLPGVTNLFLAGDYCRSEIDMPSVEG